MTVSDLEILYAYGYWANRRLFDVIAKPTPDEFTRSVTGSYGSIRNTLVHTLSAEAGWLERCGGPRRGPRLTSTDFSTLESVVQRWSTVETQLLAFLGTLKDDDLTRHIEFTVDQTGKQAMPLGELLHHAANHGVHHRGQVALLLRSLGHVPGNVDILYFYANRLGIPAP